MVVNFVLRNLTVHSSSVYCLILLRPICHCICLSNSYVYLLPQDTLAERVRIFKMHRDCESSLRGKREQKVRIEMSPKADRAKIPALEREIGEVS